MKASIDPGYTWWGWMTAEEWRLAVWYALGIAKYEAIDENIELMVAEAAKRLLDDGFSFEALSLSGDGQVMVEGDLACLCEENIIAGAMLRQDPYATLDFGDIGRTALGVSLSGRLGVEAADRVESLWEEYVAALDGHKKTVMGMVH